MFYADEFSIGTVLVPAIVLEHRTGTCYYLPMLNANDYGHSDIRSLAEITADLRAAERALRIHRARVGDDMGCDGSLDVDRELVMEVLAFREEMERARRHYGR